MPEYQLQIKQVVDYPRCRIYREFIHKLINDRSIRINGGSGLFHFTVLCSYANFRTSYRRIDGISYTVSPGEWVCTVKELSCWFRTRFHRQALSMLDTLQKQHLISYTLLGRGNVVKYKILHWARHNSALEYNAPCQKDTGFFFLPVSVALELVSSARCSEMDIVLDLWVSAVYNDTQVQGSEVGPVVSFVTLAADFVQAAQRGGVELKNGGSPAVYSGKYIGIVTLIVHDVAQIIFLHIVHEGGAVCLQHPITEECLITGQRLTEVLRHGDALSGVDREKLHLDRRGIRVAFHLNAVGVAFIGAG